MLRLTREERAVLRDKLPDLANLAAGTAVFGQLLRDDAYSSALAFTGAVIWAALMALTFLATREQR
jgi:hypothetical protein